MSYSGNIDAALEKLLSSQRELLSGMNKHRTSQGGQLLTNMDFVAAAPLENTWQDSMGQQQQQQQQKLQPPTYHNHVPSRRSSLDMLLSRRLSIDVGYNGHVMHSFSSHDETCHERGALSDKYILPSFSHDELDLDWSETSMYKKRRLSQSSLISLTDVSCRRFSFALSAIDEDEESAVLEIGVISGEPEETSADTVLVTSAVGEAKIVETKQESRGHVWELVQTDALESFQKAMKHSESSRQCIHNMDCKTSLKPLLRSTMQKSSLSRKRLRNVLP